MFRENQKISFDLVKEMKSCLFSFNLFNISTKRRNISRYYLADDFSTVPAPDVSADARSQGRQLLPSVRLTQVSFILSTLLLTSRESKSSPKSITRLNPPKTLRYPSKT